MSRIAILACFLTLSGWVHGQRTLSLPDCVKLATEQNLSLRQGSTGLEFTAKAANQSRLLLLPNLNAGASYFWNFGYTIDPVTNLPLSNNFSANSYQLTAAMNLFSGGSVASTIKKSKADLDVADMNFKATVDNVQFQVIAAYLAVMFAEEQQKVAEQKISTTELQLSNSRKLVQAGTLPEGNLLAIEAQLAQDELSIIQARNQVEKTYLDLKLLLQLEADEQIAIIYPDVTRFNQLLTAPVPDTKMVADYAIANKASIKSYDYQLQSAELAKNIAAAGAYPSLSLIGQVSTNYSSASYPQFGIEADPFGEQIDNNLSQVVGLSLTIPLFNNGQVLLNKQNADLAIINTQLNRELAVNTMRQNVTQAINDLRAAQASFVASQKSYDAAESAFAFAEKKFNAGTVSSFDYTNALNAKAQAESFLVQAKYDLIFKAKIVDYYLDKPIDF
jgi:outer membrane protein